MDVYQYCVFMLSTLQTSQSQSMGQIHCRRQLPQPCVCCAHCLQVVSIFNCMQKLADLEQRQAASKELLLLLTNASRTEWSALMALYPKITLFINCFHLACPRGQWTSHTGNPYITSPTTPTGFLLLRRLIIRLSECVRVRKGCSQRT